MVLPTPAPTPNRWSRQIYLPLMTTTLLGYRFHIWAFDPDDRSSNAPRSPRRRRRPAIVETKGP